jgi:HEAT repeats
VRRVSILLILTGLALPGCTSYFTETNPEEPWNKDRFQEVKHEDARRLAGEDRSKSTATDYLTWIPRTLWSGVEWSWNYSTGHTPYKYAKNLQDTNPDIRRDAIYTLSDNGFGRKHPYTTRYGDMAKTDADATVRVAGVRALNRSRDARFTSLYIALLADDSQWVRLEAAKALANIPDPKAVPQLMALLADEKQIRDIRIACADALREYRQSDVAQALIRVLADRDFGVAWQSRQSLNLMTGQDFGYDASKWLNYLTQTAQPFAVAPARVSGIQG